MTFREYLKITILEESQFKKGDKVKIKNAKSYDALLKNDVIGIVDFINKDKVAVKVGTGQINAYPKDLELIK